MWKFIMYLTVIWFVGVILGMMVSKILTLNKIQSGMKAFFIGLIRRIDETLTGNDNRYSSTRVLNLMWGIGTLSLIVICALRSIVIQEGILYLLGAVNGINTGQSIANKIQEVKTQIKLGLKGDDDVK